MQNYLSLLNDILNHGTPSADRTNTGTISLFGPQIRFDLQKGFPAVTTKKLQFNAVKAELLWFIEGSGDERRLAEIQYGTRDDAKTTIWTANANADYWKPKAKFQGDLSRVYGVQWRKWDVYDKWETSVTLVKQATKNGKNSPFSLDIALEQPDYTNADELVGQVFITNNCGKLKVLKKIGTRNGNTYYKAQFLEGIKTIVEASRPNIRKGCVKNPYAMSAAAGNGCYGIITKKQPYLTRAYNMWLNMMERCHGNDPLRTLEYKQKGIFVDSEWRCFSNFFRDIHNLVGFSKWRSDPSKYDLDKDYFGNLFYGKETTIFLPNWYNAYILTNATGQLYTAQNKKTGEIFKFTSSAFFNKWSGTSGYVDRAFRMQKGQTKDWIFSKEDPPVGYKWRQKFYHDQLLELIENIKNDPFSRRHILMAYNPGEIDQMALPPCHMMCQFYVRNDELSCQMYQRSQDVFLGGPFNYASYALLTHMIAQVCNLTPKELIVTVGDCHLYNNHVDQVQEQLKRSPKPLPTLWLNPAITDIEHFKMEDIRLVNYAHHPALTAPMAV